MINKDGWEPSELIIISREERDSKRHTEAVSFESFTLRILELARRSRAV